MAVYVFFRSGNRFDSAHDVIGVKTPLLIDKLDFVLRYISCFDAVSSTDPWRFASLAHNPELDGGRL